MTLNRAVIGHGKGYVITDPSQKTRRENFWEQQSSRTSEQIEEVKYPDAEAHRCRRRQSAEMSIMARAGFTTSLRNRSHL